MLENHVSIVSLKILSANSKYVQRTYIRTNSINILRSSNSWELDSLPDDRLCNSFTNREQFFLYEKCFFWAKGDRYITARELASQYTHVTVEYAPLLRNRNSSRQMMGYMLGTLTGVPIRMLVFDYNVSLNVSFSSQSLLENSWVCSSACHSFKGC